MEHIPPILPTTPMTKSDDMPVTQRLRTLRMRAGYSMDSIAKAIGFAGGSSYQRYENPDIFAAEYLPLALTRKLSEVLVGRGYPAITEQEVSALAGLSAAQMAAEDPTAGAAKIDTDQLQLVIRVVLTWLQEHNKTLPPAKIAEVIALVYELAEYGDSPAVTLAAHRTLKLVSG